MPVFHWYSDNILRHEKRTAIYETSKIVFWETRRTIFSKMRYTGLQITVFILSENSFGRQFCSFCKLQLFSVSKYSFAHFAKYSFSHFGKYSSSRFPKNYFTCFINCSFFSCRKILSEYQWKTIYNLFILTYLY